MRRLLPILILGLFTFSTVSSQSFTITASSPLTEINLDAEYLTLDLEGGETFIDYTTLPIDSFALVNAPPGTSIESVTGISNIEARIDLAFDTTDFDVDYYISIDIRAGELNLTGSGVLNSANTDTITALVESATLSDSVLNEVTLNNQTITIDLIQETFAVPDTLKPEDFTLNNAPDSLFIVDTVGTPTSTHVALKLAFTPGDFDDDSTNLTITINPLVLVQSSAGLTTDTITVTAVDESAELSVSSPLDEANLNSSSLTLVLEGGETFIDFSTLPIDSFALAGAPAGTSIASLTGIDDTTATIVLAFDTTDFDIDHNISIDIRAGELTMTSSGVLSSSSVLVQALEETAFMGDPSLNETALDGQSVIITLRDETFEAALESGNFVLGGTPGVNYPSGLSIESVIRSNDTVAEVDLAFDGTDFDTEFTDFYIDIDSAALVQTSSGYLTPGNRLTISPFVEVPVADLEASPPLNEAILNDQTVTIDLTQETFAVPGSLEAGDFTLNNAPGGLSILDTVGTPTSTHVELDLAFTPGDFDDDSTNFTVTINPSVLIQSSTGLITDSITITALDESAGLSASFPLNETNLNTSSLTLVLEGGETFIDFSTLPIDSFTLSGAPAGSSITSVTGIDNTTATIVLAFDTTDFDTDHNLSIDINAGELTLTSSGVLSSSSLLVQALQEAATMGDPSLNETALDGQSVIITLTDETFEAALESGNFVLGGTPGVNYPSGLSIESVIRSNDTVADVDLAFDGTDFDVEFTDFYIEIDAADLVQTSSGFLTPWNRLTISPFVEVPVADLEAVPSLNEALLNGQTVTIDLTQETFAFPGSLEAGDFTPNNAPGGLSIVGITGTATSTHVELDLAFTPGDFDNDFTNFTVTINPSVLIQSSSGLTTDAITITAVDESADLSASFPLNEALLDDQTVIIDLIQETFSFPGSLEAGDFTLNNAPPGLSIVDIIGTPTSNQVVLDLAFTPGDFDDDFTSITITINPSALVQSSAGLSTDAIAITSLDESASMSGPSLNETALDGQSVTITLTDETYDSDLEAVNFVLGGTAGVNYPTGLGIASVIRSTATEAVVNLTFDGTDFDVNFTDFYITVAAADLAQTSTGVLTPGNRLTILAYVENPVATLVPGPPLSEYSLNGRVISILLSEETFINPAGLAPGNFTPVDGPPGLSIESVSGDNTYADLVLGFDLTDFDIDYPDFHIVIDAAVLIQSSVDLVTTSLPIVYGLEPVITGVSIPNETMRIGSVVPVTITVENDEGNTFTLVEGAVIGGYPLEDLVRINETTYTCSFTVFDGGLDYPASQDIHVIGLQLMNGAIPGNLYNGYIVQDNDELDANAPEIQYIYTYMSGAQNVGSVILIWIQSNENGLTFTPESHVNNVPLSNPAVDTSFIGFGRYSLSYVVGEGDDNVDPGELVVSMQAIDEAGNLGTPTPIDINDLSIDASSPVIIRAYISSPDDDVSVGETIEITVVADQTGYRNLGAGTWINGVYVEPGHLTFTDQGDNTYLYSYTVQEADGVVARGELAINIILQDAAPFSNTSPAFTALDPNNLQIVTSRPSALISGSAEICPGESATITVDLGGTSPWYLEIFDGTGTTQHTSTGATYTFSVNPEVSTVFTVTRVVDGSGNDNTGTGTANVTIPQMPVVQIFNLQESYDVLSQPVVLAYTPAQGTFTGPGISGNPWTFSPESAGVSAPSSPHEIVFTYTDAQSTCTRSDTREVIVVSGSGVIDTEKEVACFNDVSFQITGSNVYGTTGTFSTRPVLIPAAFQDMGNNTAVLRPDVLEYQGFDQMLIIEYTFEGLAGSEFKLSDTLTIEYLDDARIDFIPDVQICQNEQSLTLSGNYDEMMTGYSFTSSGGGVVPDSSGNYRFDPLLASLGTNLVLYEYISPSQCRVSDSVELMIHDAPNTGFTAEEPCISLEGGMVRFLNRSDTGVAFTWRWDFGDPSSGASNNMSDLENPTHHYADTGNYTVSLNVTIGICEDQVVKTIDLNPAPEADFSWNSNCQTDAPIFMTGQETVYFPDTVSNWRWVINDSAGTEIFRSDTSGGQFSYDFPAVGTYRVRYVVLTGNRCSDTIEKTISLSPTILLSPDSPFLEDFELATHGWESGAENGHSSWIYNEVNLDEFPVDTVSGRWAWYTDRPDEPTWENSWVLSPCFNFNDFHRPMVSLDIKRSLHRNRDGAALQYTIDNGVTWKNVGDVNDGGIEWYNSTGITPDVGGKRTGWTGGLVDKEDDQWYKAAHGLDDVAGEPEVRFRIAFGALDDTRTETNDGFAFDNFNLRQRTRLSVLEYFTNANTEKCADTDSVIMRLMNEVQSDVIDIQYHAAGSLADKFFMDNRVPANNRGTFYGVTSIPYAILDGNVRTYDFSGNLETPKAEDIRLRSLTDPDFQLTITVTHYTPTLEFSIEMKALRDLERKERTLHAIVLQRRVDDPTYVGTNGLTVFRHVARKMLPDAGGTYLGSKSWSKDETEYANLTYPSAFFPTDTMTITIAVFMQDEQTHEILQATTNPQYTVSVADLIESPMQVLVYPNPARELVNVYFEESPEEKMRFALYDLSGKMVIADAIEPWQQHFTRTMDDVEQGMYILEIRTWDKRRVLYRDKLLTY